MAFMGNVILRLYSLIPLRTTEFKVERKEMAGQSNHELSLFSSEEVWTNDNFHILGFFVSQLA